MQNINSDLIRGNIDTIILKTMENGDMYGLDIIREVENKSSGTYELKQPTLYSCLKRLENKELISSYWLDSEIGGKRHYYKLTDKGREVIQTKQDEWSKSKLLIDNLLGDFNSEEYRLVKKDDYDKIINGKPVIQYVEVEKPVIIETPVYINQKEDSVSNNDKLNLINEENYEHDLSEQNSEILDNPNTEEDITKEFIDLKSNNLISLDSNNIEDSKSDNIVVETNHNEKRSLLDNELIYFKPKTENTITEKNVSETNKNQSESFEQTSAFDLKPQQKQESQPIKINSEKVVQQDLFSNILMPYQVEVDNSINEFSNNISMLNKINSSSDLSAIDNEQKTDDELKINDDINIDSTEESNFNPSEEDIQNLEGNKHSNIHTQINEDGLLNELNELNLSEYSNKNIAFENDDEYYYTKHTENVNNNSNNQQFNNLNQKSNTSSNNIEQENLKHSTESVPIKNNLNYANENAIIDQKYDQLFSAKESIDEIIYKNVNEYTSENSREFIANTLSHYKNVREDEFKQRIDNLSEYAKKPYEDFEEIKYSKDIQTLKEEYKNEGIVIKEFNKEDSFKLKKNYLVINKLNLIKSTILLFGYVFILSALFIIMDSTSLKNMHDFSFKFFLYAFIPFIIYVLYYLVLYLVNPYKKVPAKHSIKFMFFVSIIITVQLLLITYCLNLQMGFYSFTQEGYNHLYWIIPTIVSFAPIVSTSIYYGLCHSKNFNI